MLSIEDILPFFPDFIVIDTFKHEICTSLQQYNMEIDALQVETDEYQRCGSNICRETDTIHSQKVCLNASTRCALSGYPIITCPFYYFPSGFTYLSNALLTEHTILQLATFQGGRVCQLAKQPRPNSNLGSRGLDQTELDSLIATACPLTSTLMIDSIDAPLYTKLELFTWSVNP